MTNLLGMFISRYSFMKQRYTSTICVCFNDDHACLSNNGILIKYQSGYASYDEPHTPALALLCQL